MSSQFFHATLMWRDLVYLRQIHQLNKNKLTWSQIRFTNILIWLILLSNLPVKAVISNKNEKVFTAYVNPCHIQRRAGLLSSFAIEGNFLGIFMRLAENTKFTTQISAAVTKRRGNQWNLIFTCQLRYKLSCAQSDTHSHTRPNNEMKDSTHAHIWD